MLQSLSNTNGNSNSSYINSKINCLECEIEETNTNIDDVKSRVCTNETNIATLQQCVSDGVFTDLDTNTFSSNEVTTDEINPKTTTTLVINAPTTTAHYICAEKVIASDDVEANGVSLVDTAASITQIESDIDNLTCSVSGVEDLANQVQCNLETFSDNLAEEITTDSLTTTNATVSSITGTSACIACIENSEATISALTNSFRTVKESNTFVEPTTKDDSSYYLFKLPAKINGTYEVIGVDEDDEVLFGAVFITHTANNGILNDGMGMTIVSYSAKNKYYFYQIKKDFTNNQLYFLTQASIKRLHIIASTVETSDLPTYEIYPSLSTVPDFDLNVTTEQSDHTYFLGDEDTLNGGVDIMGRLHATSVDIPSTISENAYICGNIFAGYNSTTGSFETCATVGSILTCSKNVADDDVLTWIEGDARDVVRLDEDGYVNFEQSLSCTSYPAMIHKEDTLVDEVSLANYDGNVVLSDGTPTLQTTTYSSAYTDQSTSWYKDSAATIRLDTISQDVPTYTLTLHNENTDEDEDFVLGFGDTWTFDVVRDSDSTVVYSPTAPIYFMLDYGINNLSSISDDISNYSFVKDGVSYHYVDLVSNQDYTYTTNGNTVVFDKDETYGGDSANLLYMWDSSTSSWEIVDSTVMSQFRWTSFPSWYFYYATHTGATGRDIKVGDTVINLVDYVNTYTATWADSSTQNGLATDTFTYYTSEVVSCYPISHLRCDTCVHGNIEVEDTVKTDTITNKTSNTAVTIDSDLVVCDDATINGNTTINCDTLICGDLCVCGTECIPEIQAECVYASCCVETPNITTDSGDLNISPASCCVKINNTVEVNTINPSTGCNLNITSCCGVQVTTGGNINLNGDTYQNGDLVVCGDIYQCGSSYETHAEELYTKCDCIFMRDGATVGLSSGDYTGIVAKCYDGTNDGILVFDCEGEARVGDLGDEQPILTRSEKTCLCNNDIFVWDSSNNCATNITRPTLNNTTLVAQVDSNTNCVTYCWDVAASAVSNLTDVCLSNLTDGQYLQYDATTCTWNNTDLGPVMSSECSDECRLSIIHYACPEDIDTAISNGCLAEGQIVSTTNNEADSIMTTLTAYVRNQNVLSSPELIGTCSCVDGCVMCYDGFVYINRPSYKGFSGCLIRDGITMDITDVSYCSGQHSLALPVYQCDTLYVSGCCTSGTVYASFYKLRDYTGR